MIVRKIEKADYHAVASLFCNEFGYSSLDYDKFLVRMELMKTEPCYTIFVAQKSDILIGFIGLVRGIAYEIEGEYIRIIALAVSQEQQGKGAGSTLLKHAEKFSLQLGVSSIILNSGLKRVRAHAFYEMNVFIKKSFGFYKVI